MERIENDLLKLKFLQEEHHQRYQYVANYAKGKVVDCACGIGYSAPILLANPKVTSYIGLDVDQEALNYAQQQKLDRTNFKYGSILALPFEDRSIDTFISLETLEHLEQPELAVAEVKRVLKPDGLFICSVPTREYEHFCVDLYGPNPYHLQAFSFETLNLLLQTQFLHVDVAVIAQEIASIVHPLRNETTQVQVFAAEHKNYMNGSFVAISSNTQLINNQATLFMGMSRIEYDQEVIYPLRQSLKFAEDLAKKRWQLLLEAEQQIENVKYYKEQAEHISEERLQAFKATEYLVVERDQALIKAEQKINELIVHKEQAEHISEERLQMLLSVSELLRKQEHALSEAKALIETLREPSKNDS